MRSILISILASLSVSAYAESNAKLHIPKSFGSKIITEGPINYSEAARIISDIAALPSLQKSDTLDFSKSSNAYLMIVGNGMESCLPNLDKFDIAPENVRNSVKTWKILRGVETESFDIPASVLEVFGQAYPGSMQISLSGNSDLLDALSVDKQFIHNSNTASILIQKTFTTRLNPSKLSSSLKDIVTEETSKKINQEIFSNEFDLSLPCDRSFIGEYTALFELNRLLQVNTQLMSLIRDGIPDYYSIGFSSLWDLQKIHGSDSIKYQVAKTKTEESIQNLKKTLDNLYQGVVEQIISFEGESSIKIVSKVVKRDAHDTLSPCFPTLNDCQNSTTNCTSQGTCIEVKRRVVNGETVEICYKCDCNHGYTGDVCEFEDKVALFHLIFWTSLILIIALILVVVTLAYMDPGTDTLLFRTGSQRPKTE